MRKLLVGLLVAGAAIVAAPASAAVTITTGDTTNPIPGNNDFQANLNALGLFDFTTTNATITLDTGAQILFEFLGSESGFSDTFSTAGATPLSLTENSTLENHFASPIVIGADSFLAGSLAGLLNFTSSGGAAATVGEDGFGIFLPAGFTGSMSTNTFYLGYDDRINNADDNHDDFIVRATVLPEPGTWAMMLLGFGAAGFAMRRQRKPVLAQLA
jgi:hypothetical protein